MQARKNGIMTFREPCVTSLTTQKSNVVLAESSAGRNIAQAFMTIILTIRIWTKMLRKIEFHFVPFLLVNDKQCKYTKRKVTKQELINS